MHILYYIDLFEMALSKNDFIALYRSNHHKYCNPRTIKKNFPEIYDAISQILSPDFKTALYMYVNGIDEIPKCPICGKKVKYKGSAIGFCKYCSSKCAANSPETKLIREATCMAEYGVKNISVITRKKASETMVKNYGVPHALQSRGILAKQKSTMLERYGVENAGSSPELIEKATQTMLERYGGRWNASPEIKEKTIRTNFARYGSKIPSMSPEIKHHMINTCLERYGVPFAGMALEVRKKMRETMLERYGVESIFCDQEKMSKIRLRNKNQFINTNPHLIRYDGSNWVCKCPHEKCNKCDAKEYITSCKIYNDRRRCSAEQCTILNPIGHNNQSTGIELFIRDILDAHNIKYECNVWNRIAPYELDIYIPSQNMAIECNGTYWHSDKWKDRDYHINKKQACAATNINLITIWEDQFINKPHIVESIILSKLGIYKRRFGARQCKIKEITCKTCVEFLDANHIQGRTSSSVKLGAYIGNELVGVMTFIQSRGCQGSKQHIEGQWELNRFCTALNTQVIGLTSKMLQHFIKQYHPKTVVSFSHNDISNGEVYNKLGFTKTGTTNRSYYYVDSLNRRYHRSTFTRAGIVRKWPEYDINDKSWTERLVMDAKKFKRINDCGTQKWVLTI